MKITGTMLIGSEEVRGSQGTMRAFNPAIGKELAEYFGAGGIDEVERACGLAHEASGQLTASLFAQDEDLEAARSFVPLLERKAGRIIFNQYPTGVEVSYAMVHGGPFPATFDSRTTSVGASAIERFLRPVCYQNMPAALLPASLQDANPMKLWRLRDGNFSQQ